MLNTNRSQIKRKGKIFQRKLDIYADHMAENVENDIDELPVSIFEKAMNQIAKKHSDKYQFILQGGKSMKDAIFKLMKLVWRTEIIPKGWKKSTLVQIWKQKGWKEDLEMMRFIHMRTDLSKLLGMMVTETVKETLVKNMTVYQIAAKPGHRSTEHLYTV